MKVVQLKSKFILFILLIFAACNSAQEKKPDVPQNEVNPEVVNNPATASSVAGTDNVPVFQFTEESHDFGNITQGEKISYAFRFKNTGKGDLIIRAANGSCGCTVPEYSKEPIHPGGEGVINITYNSEGKEGRQDNTVSLIANTIPNTKVLSITGNVLLPENK